jgi:hypothetical protein
MHPILRNLCTLMACAMLGAVVGVQSSPSVTPKKSRASSQAPIGIHQTAFHGAKAPRFTSIDASVSWIRQEIEKGNCGAAELLFQEDSGLTPEQRLRLAKELVRDFRRHDPWVLSHIVMVLPPGPEADIVLGSLVAEWSREDAEGALRFLERLPPERLNTVRVLQNAAFGLCRLPAERVLAFASRLTDKGRAYLAEGLTAFANQAGSWRNSSAILSQLNAKPHEDVISAEYYMGMHLAEIAPEVMKGQISAETDVLKRDEMLRGYASRVRKSDPVQGMELCAQISKQEVRQPELETHVELWLRSDRTAALTWLQGENAWQQLPAELRSKLLKSYGWEAAR